ncbi:MAG TPA: hypothetical protein VNN79_07305 [Actinomycetota bacterium]|nr:hypothetical protein [Actinomycetota bacterium]
MAWLNRLREVDDDCYTFGVRLAAVVWPTSPKRRSGLKRDSKDAAWSKMVRERAGFRCQFVPWAPDIVAAELRCTAEVGKGLNAQGLHAAHCFGRGNSRTRLDPDNGLALCWPHHRQVDGEKAMRYWLFRYWLGDERFDELQAKANAKRDRRQNA